MRKVTTDHSVIWWPETWEGHPDALANIRMNATGEYRGRQWEIPPDDQIRTVIKRDFSRTQRVEKVLIGGYQVSSFYRVRPGDEIIFIG